MVNSFTAARTLALVGAFAASASAMSAGSAVVVNQCSYEVYLCAVPAAGGGQTEEDKTLSTGDSWTMPYTELTNGQGWSIKLSNSTSLEHILQYEYTFHNDGTIWFDLSCVNGDPWPQNWEITADNGCTPKQTAYMYPTDDDYGMQACAQDATVEVTLCAYEGGSEPSTSAAAYTPATTSVYSAPAYTPSSSSEAPVQTTAAAAPSAPVVPSPPAYTGWGGFSNNDHGLVQANENYAPHVAAASPTTLATSVTQQDDSGIATVWDVVTAVETAVVTAYGRHRRHEHHAHQHQA